MHIASTKQVDPVVRFGVQIVPFMTPNDVVTVASEAERIGYDYCLIADEGFRADIYACLGAIAQRTERIRLGPVTNGYTRHPAVTASAMATLNSMSGGRALITMLAGGSMVLAPMAIVREKPYRVVADAIDAMRLLWTGGEVTWEGRRHRLDRAQLASELLEPPAEDIPIWLATRGPMLLHLAGRSTEGALVTVKPDLGEALAIVEEGAASVGRAVPARMYLGRICYTPEMVAEQKRTMAYVLMDSPPRVLRSLGFDDAGIDTVARAVEENSPGLLSEHMTDELLSRYQVTGTSEECVGGVARLVAEHRLDVVVADLLSPSLRENIEHMEQTYRILSDSRK